ncbi:hypothetical protein EC968_004973 [Mortierella alpina]|nr:hypothetical protein EC968_004973 [Mortierella alpina]
MILQSKLEAHLEVPGQDDFNVVQYMSQFYNASSGPKPYPYVLRGVIKTSQDVASLFIPHDKIKVLALDPGQAYGVGASVWLPEEPGKMKRHHDPSDAECQKDIIMTPSCNNNIKAAPDPEATAGSETFFNLTVSQRAVYQPTFAFRRWLQTEKNRHRKLIAAMSGSARKHG